VLLAWRDAPTSFSAAASRLAIGRLRGDEKQRVQRGTEAVVSASGCCGPAVGVRVGVGGGGGRVAGGSGRPARGAGRPARGPAGGLLGAAELPLLDRDGEGRQGAPPGRLWGGGAASAGRRWGGAEVGRRGARRAAAAARSSGV